MDFQINQEGFQKAFKKLVMVVLEGLLKDVEKAPLKAFEARLKAFKRTLNSFCKAFWKTCKIKIKPIKGL